MSTLAISNALAWVRQAESDVRVAVALATVPPTPPMLSNDVGCHVAAMCAQAIEKSLKGYLFLNGNAPKMNHRPDKYLPQLLTRDLLRYQEHHQHLAKLFNSQTKGVVRKLLDLTPGGRGSQFCFPNTEYPWQYPLDDQWRHVPLDAAIFADQAEIKLWLAVASRVQTLLHKLCKAADLRPEG